MTEQSGPSQWVSYSIYVGQVAGGLEYLITEILPRVLNCVALESWFFIRYFDAGGFHLRVRLKPSGTGLALREAIAPILDEAIRMLPRVPPPTNVPIVKASRIVNERSRVSLIRVTENSYKPETDKFGVEGMAVAEKLFRISSETAMCILGDERNNVYSRKTLAPLLMWAVCDAFVQPLSPSFWASYSKYWLQFSGKSAHNWQPQFTSKARELQERGVPILMPDANLPPAALKLLRSWRLGVANAASQFAAHEEPTPGGSLALAANFIHLMNNRLGFQPIEEAYLAALLEDSARE